MGQLEDGRWPNWAVEENETALEGAATVTLLIMDSLIKVIGQENETRFVPIIEKGAKSILRCVIVRNKQLNMREAGNAFLDLAINIEKLLLDLLLEKEKASRALEQEDILLNMMGRMNLTSQP